MVTKKLLIKCANHLIRVTTTCVEIYTIELNRVKTNKT